MADFDVFESPVSQYMTTDVETARLESDVQTIARAMHTRGISGVPILDEDDWVAGVITRTDLIQLGLLHAGRRTTGAVMGLPHRRAKEIMKHDPKLIPSTATLREAARTMAEHGIHRLFVLTGEQLVGVIAALDIVRAFRDSGIDKELATIMSSPIATVDIRSPLGAATELLERLRVTQVIVTDEGQPVGVFAQADALATRELPRNTPIETVYDAAVLCLPAATKLSRAAAHVAGLDVRRVVVCKDREAIGIVTALDFVRFVTL